MDNTTQKTPLNQNLIKFIVGFAVGILIVVIFFFATSGSISKSEFNKIKNGMTYEEVCDIIGSKGEKSVESSYGGYSAEIYTWKGSLYFVSGANAAIYFDNGRVTSKAATGLIF